MVILNNVEKKYLLSRKEQPENSGARIYKEFSGQ